MSDESSFDAMYARITERSVLEASRQELEEAILMWRNLREARLDMEHRANSIKEFETAAKSWVLEVFKQQKHEGVLIGGRVTSLTTRPVATVDDKEALLSHIRSTGELDLLQFKLSTSAVDGRKEVGEDVPGVTYIDIYDLSDKQL